MHGQAVAILPDDARIPRRQVPAVQGVDRGDAFCKSHAARREEIVHLGTFRNDGGHGRCNEGENAGIADHPGGRPPDSIQTVEIHRRVEDFQCPGVQGAHVEGGVHDNDGAVRHGPVQVMPGGHGFLGQILLVEKTAVDPLAFIGAPGALGDALQNGTKMVGVVKMHRRRL
jgi:hypothetical protein